VPWGQRREAFRKFHHGAVRKAREHHMLEPAELIDQRGSDFRIRVPEQIDPPGAHRVEVTATVEIVEPRAFAARDGDERQRLVLLHLRARMPDGAKAPLDPRCAVSGTRIRPRGR
jgi:hypothetical protein